MVTERKATNPEVAWSRLRDRQQPGRFPAYLATPPRKVWPSNREIMLLTFPGDQWEVRRYLKSPLSSPSKTPVEIGGDRRRFSYRAFHYSDRSGLGWNKQEMKNFRLEIHQFRTRITESKVVVVPSESFRSLDPCVQEGFLLQKMFRRRPSSC